MGSVRILDLSCVRSPWIRRTVLWLLTSYREMIRERSWCQETRVEVLWSIILTSQVGTIAFNLLINPKKTLILGHPGKQNLYFLETLYVYSEHFFHKEKLQKKFFRATCNFVQIDEGQNYFHYLLGNIHSIIRVFNLVL